VRAAEKAVEFLSTRLRALGEISKLSAVAWFGGRPHARAGCAVRARCLNAIGAYAFLSQGAQQLSGDVATVGKSAEIGAKVEAPQQTIADLDKRIGQIDEAVSVATKRGRTSSAIARLIWRQRNARQRDALRRA
jgi:hypothetical protein